MKKSPKVDSSGVEDRQRSEWSKDVEEWVQHSCGAQGVPVKVTNAAVLGQVAVMLGAGRLPSLGSHSPGDFESGWIESGAALNGRIDSQVSDEGPDDGALAIGSKVGPLRSEVLRVADIALKC